MVTGDSAGAARAAASAVGLPQEHVHAALLPADKLKQVRCCSGQSHACLGTPGDGLPELLRTFPGTRVTHRRMRRSHSLATVCSEGRM